VISFDLTGRTALVTGASSGIGRHLALTLARAGAAVVATARRTDPLVGLVAEIEAAGARARGIMLDVTDRASTIRALNQVSDQFGVVDILVNNAGVAGSKRALEYEDSDWTQILGTNLTGAWLVSQEAARRLIAAERPGSIINISSILATGIATGTSPYCASKAGLRQLTRCLALELARHRIRVNSIAPGYIVTELNREYLMGPGGQSLKSRNPMRRFGEYADLEGALLLLASDAGRYMTGSEIIVDGGQLCAPL